MTGDFLLYWFWKLAGESFLTVLCLVCEITRFKNHTVWEIGLDLAFAGGVR